MFTCCIVATERLRVWSRPTPREPILLLRNFEDGIFLAGVDHEVAASGYKCAPAPGCTLAPVITLTLGVHPCPCRCTCSSLGMQCPPGCAPTAGCTHAPGGTLPLGAPYPGCTPAPEIALSLTCVPAPRMHPCPWCYPGCTLLSLDMPLPVDTPDQVLDALVSGCPLRVFCGYFPGVFARGGWVVLFP